MMMDIAALSILSPYDIIAICSNHSTPLSHRWCIHVDIKKGGKTSVNLAHLPLSRQQKLLASLIICLQAVLISDGPL